MINIELIIAKVRNKAHNKREGAAHNGSWSDGGATAVEAEAKFYEYGMAGVMPPEWKEYETEVKREIDPEYAEYIRLHEKFN